jgi:signal transduction histidine kinase/DNA-binding response OmpR family regulator
VYHFYEKEDGNILLCTTTGLYEMQLGKGIIARYWFGGKGKYHLPATDFRHLYFDKKTQSYWLATNETGLIQWNPKTNTSKIHTFNYKAANIIHAVYADKFGFLWLSTENGIIQFEKKTGDFKTFSTKEGTSSHEFNRISHFQDQESGKIYFGSIVGLTVFEPKYFYQSFKDLNKIKIIPIEISQYKDDAEEIQNVTADFYQKKQVDFYPNDRFLTITFGLNKYSYSKDAVYYYKLANIDKHWTISKDNEITISGIPYGKQILEVKALLANGKFTKKNLKITIVVHKPFYLQWWFFVGIFLLIFGVTWFYIRYQTQRFELQTIILENEVKKRTLKIEEQTVKLIELDKTKTRFFANVSHELRTPITLIKAPIQSVINSQVLSKNNEYLLKKAKENTNNLLNLVNEILDLTKLDNQKLKLKEEKVLFYNFIRQILSYFQSIAEMQNITLILEYHAEKELQILLDRGKFQKVLNNLLSNALKFTPSNGKIVLSVQDLGIEILLKLRDNGRGISEVDIPHVFERYFQSSQNSKAEGGLGIGLALSMELIKLFKGKIELESSTKKENQGTTFFVKFPKKEVLNMLTSENIETIEGDFSKQKNRKISPKINLTNKEATKTILIVEDNKDLRDYLSFILSTSYTVLTAQNGKKALEIIAKGQIPNLIISDLMMPIMDGHEFLGVVKNNDKLTGIPFIMLTARAILQDKLKALRIGVDDYITKPFEEEELLVRVENLLVNNEERIKFIQYEQENTQNVKEKGTNLTISAEDRKWLEDFENQIIKHLGSSLFTVDYLVELMDLGRTSLYKKVKTLTGLSPNQYIKVIRLKLAKDYLENKKYKTIKEVGKHVGFAKVDYFSTIFKKEYGKSPSSYFT